ncbi:hypothetical protein OF83DRAFT_435347 [Amylostereum chailletii]|nr:hypothetical protein OF83DRAFT_435347 [Amylostereum chailletii]
MPHPNVTHVPAVFKAAADLAAVPALRPSSAVPKAVANKSKFSDLGRRTIAQELPQPGPSRKPTVQDDVDAPADPLEDLFAPQKFRGAPQAQWGGAAAARLSTNLARHAGERPPDDVLQEILTAADIPKQKGNEYTQKKHLGTMNAWNAHLFRCGVSEEDAWKVQTVRKYGVGYLRTRAVVTPGRFDVHVKASTVQEWLITFVNCIVMYCHDSTSNELVGLRLLMQADFYTQLEDEMNSIIRELKLDRKREPVHRFGRHEVRLILIEAMANSSNVGRMVKIQTCCAILLGFILGVRPGSLAASSISYRALGKFKNITIERVGTLEFVVTLNIDNWKGFQTGAYQKDQDFILEPVKRAHNLPFEPSMWIVLYMLLRGAFGPGLVRRAFPPPPPPPPHPSIHAYVHLQTLDDLYRDQTAILEVVPDMLEQPFFLSLTPGGTGFTSEAAIAPTLYHTISKLAVNAGLPSTGLYALRRETGNYYIMVLNKDKAGSILGHSSRDFRTLSRFYSRDAANLSLTRVRLGDFDDEPDEMTKVSLGLHERGCAAVMALIGRIAPEKSQTKDDQFTGRGKTTVAPIVFDEEDDAQVDNDPVALGLRRRIIVVWDHWISFLVSDGTGHRHFDQYLLDSSKKIKQNIPIILKRKDVRFIGFDAAAEIPELASDPDSDELESNAVNMSAQPPLFYSLRPGVESDALSDRDKSVLKRAGEVRIKLNALYAELRSRRSSVAKGIRMDIGAQRAVETNAIRRAAKVLDRTVALDHLKSTVPLLANAVAAGGTSALETDAARHAAKGKDRAVALTHSKTTTPPLAEAVAVPAPDDPAILSAAPWPVTEGLLFPDFSDMPVAPTDDAGMNEWEAYHQKVEAWMAAQDTEPAQEQEDLAATTLERDVILTFDTPLRNKVHATKQGFAGTRRSEHAFQDNDVEHGFIQEEDARPGRFQVDNPDEPDIHRMDASLRYAFMNYILAPINNERDRELRYKTADGRWACDDPGCDITLLTWGHLLRHQLLHTPWRKLIDTVARRKGATRWTCPSDDIEQANRAPPRFLLETK